MLSERFRPHRKCTVRLGKNICELGKWIPFFYSWRSNWKNVLMPFEVFLDKQGWKSFGFISNDCLFERSFWSIDWLLEVLQITRFFWSHSRIFWKSHKRDSDRERRMIFSLKVESGRLHNCENEIRGERRSLRCNRNKFGTWGTPALVVWKPVHKTEMRRLDR